MISPELAFAIGICCGMIVMAIIASHSHRRDIEDLETKMQEQDTSWKHQVDTLVDKVEELERENQYLQSQLSLRK